MLVRLIVNTLALLAVFFLVWNVHGDFGQVLLPAIVMAVVLAVVNAFIRPVILLLTLPISIITLGLFALLVNAVLFYIAARLVHIEVSFFRGFLGYIAFVVITAALNALGIFE
jgi:putative membrane protein